MTKSKHERKKARRKQLYEQNPFCPDCNVKMVLPEDVGFFTHKNGLRSILDNPDNLCTLEHKYSRLNPKRKEPVNNEVRWFILCTKCNNKRSKIDHETFLTKEELHERSQRHEKR